MIVPAIVMFELEYGCAKSKRPEETRRALEIFLSAGFDRPAFDSEDAREAGEIRAHLEVARPADRTLRYVDRRSGAPARGKARDSERSGIRARARALGGRLPGAPARRKLVTLNVREFERVPKLSVEDWAA